MSQRMGRGDGTFVHTRSGLVKQSRATSYFLVITFFILSIVWFIFVSKYWSVKTIDVQGDLKDVSRGEVEVAAYDLIDNGTRKPWDQRNIFFIDEKILAGEIKERLFADYVTVDKVYPSVLRLLVVERQRRVVYVSNGLYQTVDPDGSITGIEKDDGYIKDRLAGKTFADPNHPPIIVQIRSAAADSISTSSEMVIDDLGVTSTQVLDESGPMSRLTDAETVKGWLDATHELLKAGIRFRYIKVSSPTSRTFKIVSDQGFDVVMDLKTDLKAQIDTYQRFIASKPKGTDIHEYVDVRIPGKIYLK